MDKLTNPTPQKHRLHCPYLWWYVLDRRLPVAMAHHWQSPWENVGDPFKNYQQRPALKRYNGLGPKNHKHNQSTNQAFLDKPRQDSVKIYNDFPKEWVLILGHNLAGDKAPWQLHQQVQQEA